MSTLTALARAEAVRAGIAQPITTVRHTHIHRRPLVFVPLTLSGEANAPLAAMVGDNPDKPQLLIVSQPRDRDLRFTFAAELADIVVDYIDSFATEVEAVSAGRGKEIRVRYADAPQIIVPNRGGLGFAHLLGRSTRFRRIDGDYAVAPVVPEFGRWLTFLADRAEHPGSSLLLAATHALTDHWATGQSAVEDQNLAALLGWIDPPTGVSGADAARAAEDPLIWPPAGPATDPTFDNEVLAPLIGSAEGSALERALARVLDPTWTLVWRAIELLNGLPEGGSVESRWGEDKDAYTTYLTYVRDAGLPQPRRDSAVAAAGRLHRLERAQVSYATQRAFDDPLVFAEYRLTGEAFAGTVTATEPARVVGEGRSRKLRPRLTVSTLDPVRLSPGTELVAVTRPGQSATVVEVKVIEANDGAVKGVEVLLELSGGMGRGLAPEPGTMPALDEEICYTSLTGGFQPSASFPGRDDTPWTHGGPPPAYEPSDDEARADASEVWE
jgi:hypothetical protein